MYVLIGEFKRKLAAIIAAYAFGSALNILSILFGLNSLSVSAYNFQYFIFLVCYGLSLILIKDRGYVLSFGRAHDFGFILSMRVLTWLLVTVSIFSVLYIDHSYTFVELLQYIFVLSLNVIFSQEIRQLLFNRKLRG